MKNSGKIMQFTLIALACICLLFVSTISHIAQATPAITSSIITDWTAVAEGATGESAAIDLSPNYATAAHIQGFTDMNDAHEGTRFIVQLSGMSTGDEDWSDLLEFVALVGDGDSEPIDDDPLSASSTTITISDTGGNFENESSGLWIAIEDGTLVNSELCWLTSHTDDTSFTILDGTTNAHAVDTLVWDTAFSKTINIPFGVGYRARVVVDNSYDADGTASSLNYKVGKTVTTDMEE